MHPVRFEMIGQNVHGNLPPATGGADANERASVTRSHRVMRNGQPRGSSAEGNVSSMPKGRSIHKASSCSQAIHRCRLPTLGRMIGGFRLGSCTPCAGMTLLEEVWEIKAHCFDRPKLGSQDYVVFVSSLNNIKEHRSKIETTKKAK